MMLSSCEQSKEGEVANLTERNNPQAPVYGVKEFVCMSVVHFYPNYLRTGKTEWAKKNLRTLIVRNLTQIWSKSIFPK